jgi:hypothetical protein
MYAVATSERVLYFAELAAALAYWRTQLDAPWAEVRDGHGRRVCWCYSGGGE